MSWAIVDRVFKTEIGEGGGAAKVVLLSLANHCDDDGGSSYPGPDAMQIETGLSLDTIQRQLRTLRTGGWITRNKRPVVHGHWPSWEYQISIKKLAPPSRSMRPGDRTAPRGSDKNDQAASPGVAGPHHAVSPSRTMRLKPVLEPVIEPGGPSQRVGALGPLGEKLRQSKDAATFDAWFVKGEIELVPETAGTAHVKLTARNRMFAREVENRFGDLIARLTGAERVTVEARQADATKASAR